MTHGVIQCTQLHEKVKLVSVSAHISELREKYRYQSGHNQAYTAKCTEKEKKLYKIRFGLPESSEN